MPRTSNCSCSPELVPRCLAILQRGGGAWAKNPNSGSWKVVALDAAAGPPIRMNADGTFEWIIDQSQTIRRRWRAAAQNELKYGYVNQYNCKLCGDKKGTVALLEKGEHDMNWLVTRVLTDTADGRDGILLESVDGRSYTASRLKSAR